MSATDTTTAREGFGSIRQGGLRWDSLPMRLFAGGNKKFWDPTEIDFSQDAKDFAEMQGPLQKLTSVLATLFIAGEEAVTEDIQPFMKAMAAEGRLEDEMYLTQFAFEEAKHTQAFRLWLDAVGVDNDLHHLIEGCNGYRTIFYEELPRALRRLEHDHSPEAQVRASVVYNHIVEGTLALTGYYAWNRICERRGIFPGMRKLIYHIGADERRHMAWGTFTCRRHVAADKSMWDLVQQTMDELTPHAIDVTYYPFTQIDLDELDLDALQEEEGEDLDQLIHEFANYATDRMGRRLNAIETALNLSPEEIEVDRKPEELEEQFAAEDQAAFEQRVAAGQVN
jgi:ribonucleoside-diphosphate reductase beta chain